MSWKRNLMEAVVRVRSAVAPSSPMPGSPRRILVLRNNDIGDLLVVTALFEALKKRFPDAEIVAAVGAWCRPVLENNPYVDDVIEVTAPWHNKAIVGQTNFKRFAYCLSSPEVAALRKRKFDVGIDVLGSPFGSLLMMEAGIPYRLGVRGYAGGHSACQRWLESDASKYVGRQALGFAEIFGVRPEDLPPAAPQLYLAERERAKGEELWRGVEGRTRLVMGVGGGFSEKCWPPERFRELLELLETSGSYAVKLVGGENDRETGAALAAGLVCVDNLCGRISLRETFALTSAAGQVVTNPSMLMHVAAAFSVPTVVSMGAFFPSVIEHNALWICRDNVIVHGCEFASGRRAIATAHEVFASVATQAPAPSFAYARAPR